MPDAIPPALSAEEWEDISGDEGFGLYEEFPNSFRSPFAAWFESTHGAHMEVSQHALAALALKDQPFGFTRYDAEMCTRMAKKLWDITGDAEGYTDLDHLAARIEALLPPEGP